MNQAGLIPLVTGGLRYPGCTNLHYENITQNNNIGLKVENPMQIEYLDRLDLARQVARSSGEQAFDFLINVTSLLLATRASRTV